MIKTLILAGGDAQYHDHLAAAQNIQRFLLKKDVVAQYSQDFNILTSERIEGYDTVIFSTQDKDLSQAEQNGLKEFITAGGSFIGLHAANVFADENHEIYEEIIGSRFIHHDPFQRFEVITDDNSFITKDISSFEIDDELYECKLLFEPDQILAWTEYKGEKHPMLYTKTIGQGEMCYLALGHDGRAWYHPSFQELLHRSLLYLNQ